MATLIEISSPRGGSENDEKKETSGISLDEARDLLRERVRVLRTWGYEVNRQQDFATARATDSSMIITLVVAPYGPEGGKVVRYDLDESYFSADGSAMCADCAEAPATVDGRCATCNEAMEEISATVCPDCGEASNGGLCDPCADASAAEIENERRAERFNEFRTWDMREDYMEQVDFSEDLWGEC